jgi:membrane associated rhomboid family serine protease
VNEARAAQRPVRSRLGIKVAAGPPIMTYGLVALNVAAFLYGMTLKPGQLIGEWGLWPHYDAQNPYVYGGTEWWRWITNGFVHTDILFLAVNMFVLVMFGRQVEMALGRARFASLYGASLVGSSAVVALFGAPDQLVGGAGAANFGLVSGYIVVLVALRAPVKPVVLQVGAWLVLYLFLSFVVWLALLGGVLTGWVVTSVILRVASRTQVPGARRG